MMLVIWFFPLGHILQKLCMLVLCHPDHLSSTAETCVLAVLLSDVFGGCSEKHTWNSWRTHFPSLASASISFLTLCSSFSCKEGKKKYALMSMVCRTIHCYRSSIHTEANILVKNSS